METIKSVKWMKQLTDAEMKKQVIRSKRKITSAITRTKFMPVTINSDRAENKNNKNPCNFCKFMKKLRYGSLRYFY